MTLEIIDLSKAKTLRMMVNAWLECYQYLTGKDLKQGSELYFEARHIAIETCMRLLTKPTEKRPS